mmetsp:Transcript_58571/g.166622  ORF Transcript_58571/g.166622 Transcript_58571/m.166622 type:complete len:298 (-) Transcript_58571:228-1121(-)
MRVSKTNSIAEPCTPCAALDGAAIFQLGHDILIVQAPLQLRALLRLQRQDVRLLVRAGGVARAQVADELGQPGRLQGGRVVGALPRAVLGEVALDPLRAHRVCRNVYGNAQVVPRKADALDAVLVLFLQQSDVEQADVLERHGVSRGAIVQHDAVRGVAAHLPEFDDLLDLVLGGHACGNVDLPSIVVAKILHHVPMHVRRGTDLDKAGVQLDDLLSRRQVPSGTGVLDADRLAVLLELPVVVKTQLEELAVFPVGGAEGVLRVRVRRRVLLRRQQLLGASLLKLAYCRTRLLCQRE